MKASANVFPIVRFAEGTAPATPAAGMVVAYAKTDGLLYAKDDAGVETPLGGGGGGSGVVETIVAGTNVTVDDTDPANPVVSATGGGGAPPIVTESTTALTADATNSGNYTRFTNASAKTYTFDDSETYTAGDEYHGRNVGAADLTITAAGGMTINPPAGGTLVIPQGGTFTVKIVDADEADLFGVTVAL